jgi:hypothetical protein
MVLEYEIRPYQENDIEKSVELLNILFDGWPSVDIDTTEDNFFRWKYHENPQRLTTGARAQKKSGEREKFPHNLCTLIKINNIDFHFEQNPRRNH